MKMKKMLLWAMAAAIPMSGAMAQAEEIECAAAPLEMESLERYPSYTCDAESGSWSVRTNEADALLERFWSYGAESGSAVCVFALELEGDLYTGIRTPVLRFYTMNASKTIAASAVSLLVDGVRYDLAACPGEATDGRRTAQTASAPLNAEAMAVVDALMTGEKIAVRLMGENTYTVELNRESTNSRRRIEAESLRGLEAARALMAEVALEDYSLWDLSADAWESKYGFAPAYMKGDVSFQLGETEISDDFGMVLRGDSTRAAKAAQQLLIDNGFLSGTASGTFTKNAASAARRAQRYLGLIETGAVDALLQQALLSGAAAEKPAAPAMSALGGVVEVALDRYWFADGVSAANASGSRRTVSNGDNVFLVADGMIRNVSAEELRMFMELGARVVYGGAYGYEAEVVCERDEGRELDTTMLPMAQSRVLVYAEVPAYLAQDAQARWSIELTANGEALEFDLQ